MHASPPRNDFADGRQRFERALLSLAQTLRQRGLSPRLLADEGRGGARLALVAHADLGTMEVKVAREAADRGTVTVLSTSGTLAVELMDAASHATPWLAPVQAACLRTIAALADELSDRFRKIAFVHPRGAVRRLGELFAGTERACGVRGRIERRRRREGIPTTDCHGATVFDGSGPRIAWWDPDRDAFELPPGVAIDLRQRHGPLDATTLAAAAIAGSVWLDERAAGREPVSVLDVLEAGELACDVASCATLPASPIDCLPDCGALTGLLDCSSLACVPLDCSC